MKPRHCDEIGSREALQLATDLRNEVFVGGIGY